METDNTIANTGTHQAIDRPLSDDHESSAKRPIADVEQTRDLPNVSLNPITKKIKLFSGNFDSDDDDESDDNNELKENKNKQNEIVKENVEFELNNSNKSSNGNLDEDLEIILQQQIDKPEEVRSEQATVVHRDGVSIPADSELLKKNEALKTYTNFVQDSSSFHSQSGIHNQLASIPLNLPAPQYLPPNIQLLINTIPSLDNLLTQILRVIVQSPYQKILDLVANPETLAGMTYQTLISLFDNIKSMYSTEDPFLSVEHLTFGLWKEGSAAPTFFRGKEDTIQSTLRKVNLATFLNATLGTIDTGFFYLNESFLDVFCPDQTLNPAQTITNLSSPALQIYDMATLSSHSVTSSLGKLLKSQTVLYLELKTQAYISALEARERSREDILNDIFPENLDELLLSRKSRFMSDSKEKPSLSPSESDFISRCQKRKANLLQADINDDLSEQYDWLTFLKDFFEFSRKHIGYLVWGSKNSFEVTSQQERSGPSRQSSSNTAAPTATTSSNTPHQNSPSSSQQPELITEGDFKYDPNSLPSEIVQHHREVRYSSSNVKHLSRRLWTKTEEQALKEALQIKGPQWSQILDLYGAGGAISEALKNRTQVQLKDKARNWKIFFLKNGLPLPDYLKNVTGELDSNKSGAKRVKKTADNKKTNKPPRIEQKHVDAANAQAAAEATAQPALKEAPASKDNDTAQSTGNEISDEANVFAQEKETERASEPAKDVSVEIVEQKQASPLPQEVKEEKKDEPLPNLEETEVATVEKEQQQEEDIQHIEEDEEPDYNNILKDLIHQATNNDNQSHNSDNNHQNVNDEDVQKLVDEVINAEKKQDETTDDK